MFFFVLGLILLAAGIVVGRNTYTNAPAARARLPLMIAGVVLAGLGFFTSTIRQIDAGEVGVKKLFGKVQPEVLGPGLHVVNPLMDVVGFDIRTQNYTMSATHDEGDKEGDDAIRVLSADGLEVVIDLTVLYRVIPEQAPRVLQTIGTDYQDRIVRPIARTRIRDNAVFYDAVALYSTRRDEFQNRILKSIETDFRARGLMLEQLLIRNIQLPESVKQTIESKINAEQESQKMQFVLQKEKQEADRKRLEAQGIADYQRIISAELTDKQLRYEQIKMQRELASSQNTKIIVLGDSKGAQLMIDTK
ncbi:MAG: prohibitin family protein [Hymenobacteraceae bacterium]|nr:prohibitin family protein [Hymenobacteraceae bacterium]